MGSFWNRSVYLVFSLLIATTVPATTNKTNCRSQPGDASFPTVQDFSQFNSSVDGRLVQAVPSAQFCKNLPGGCTDEAWADSTFTGEVPGSMRWINWEQDYTSHPPSLCFRNSTVCGQGSVPLYAVNATTAAHIQAGVRFAQDHNLKVAIKASGHDFLGRSTAKNSFLIWTRHFQSITFHDSFLIGGEDMGTAVTVGSGVGLHTLYEAAKSQGKIFVGGTAASVVAAGGYIQGGGHSALGPLYGLAADNALEFHVVLADGSLVVANGMSNSDLFWALRGGGAGSWGVVINATFRTFPTFDVVQHFSLIVANSSTAVGQLATLHAQHIFDWDNFHVGQYFFVNGSASSFTWFLSSYFPNATIAAVNMSMAPLLDAVTTIPGLDVATVVTNLANANDALSPSSNDGGGVDSIMGSRLIPTDVYRHNTSAIGKAYQALFDAGIPGILGHLVAGGQVSKNAGIDSAVNPKWRTAKTHVILETKWPDSTSSGDVEAIREDLTKNKMPVLDALAGGPGSGSYSNEADVREPHFQTTFFGLNYPRLSAIKRRYDPRDLFIVGAGVGSERWDADGLCRIS